MTTKTYRKGLDKIVDYITEHSVKFSESQKWLIEKTMELNNSGMLGSGEELQFLSNICRIIGAKKTLDIGVFTGYSSLTIASVLPENGKVYAFDITDEYLKDFCEPAWKKGGVRDKISFNLGPAIEGLNKLIADGHSGTFDFAFIDADKTGYMDYYEACLKLIRSNGLIAIDNVLWGGKVLDLNYKDEDTVAIRKLNEKLKVDDRCDISMLRMGDGVTIAFKK